MRKWLPVIAAVIFLVSPVVGYACPPPSAPDAPTGGGDGPGVPTDPSGGGVVQTDPTGGLGDGTGSGTGDGRTGGTTPTDGSSPAPGYIDTQEVTA